MIIKITLLLVFVAVVVSVGVVTRKRSTDVNGFVRLS